MNRFEKIPVPTLAITLASLTLGNVYGNLGFTWLRALIMICGTIVILAYIFKIIRFPKVCLAEYEDTVTASLYATFTMCLMSLGSFYFEKGLIIGKGIWWAGVIIQFIHILIFTVKHAYGRVISPKDSMPLMPSWFVTYNGWMVACVTGTAMDAGWLLKGMTVYGCIIYPVLLFFILRRLKNYPIRRETYHTTGVLLTPCCFCQISLIHAFKNPPVVLVFIMFILVLATLIYLIVKIPVFFSFDFYPGFAGISFPMALGALAIQKMASYTNGHGWTALAAFCTQLSGLQILIASTIVGYVLVMNLRMLFHLKKR